MNSSQVQVLLAVADPSRSAAVAHLLMQAGGAVSLVRSGERAPDSRACLLVVEVDGEPDRLRRLRTRYPNLVIVALAVQPTAQRIAAIGRLGVRDIWKWPLDSASIVKRAAALFEQVRRNGEASQPGEAAEAGATGSEPMTSDRRAEGGPPESIPDGQAAGAGVKGPAFQTGSSSAALSPPFMVGGNPRMAEIRNTIEKVSGTDVTVLVRGESGVGKEVVARLLFEHSRRRQKPLVKVNCAAIPHDLLESELFGYEAGAFTGAVRGKPGKFELAHRGTLFLDEIAEMHPALQAKLLHVLQDGRFSRLGAKGDVSVDVRIVCATNKPLEERVREGLFREDLLYRINVVTIFIPPLRERRDEIPILTDSLLRKYSAQYGRAFQPFDPAVSQRMMEYDWPGNIRELENLCKRFVLVGSETQIFRELSNRRGARSFPPGEEVSQPARPGPLSPGSSSKDALPPASARLSLLEIGRRAAWEAERRAILEALEATHWNRREASKRLQVSYKALLNKVKQMRLDDMGETHPIRG